MLCPSEQRCVAPYLRPENSRDRAVVHGVPCHGFERRSCQVWHRCAQRQCRAADAEARSLGLLSYNGLGAQFGRRVPCHS